MKSTFRLAAGILGGTLLQAGAFQRDFSPDRPDVTDGAVTVEPGVWQVETGLFEFDKDKSGGVTSRTWTFAQTNFKYGVTQLDDVEFIVSPWVEDSSRGLGMKTHDEGFGDVTLRWKHNFWGNDGGDSSFGVIPFVNIPTQTAVSTGEWEGGVILPVAFQLTKGIDLSCEVALNRVWDSDSGAHHWDFLHSASLGFDLTDSLGAYIEYIGIAGDAPFQVIGSAGFTWKQSERLQWDLGVMVGLTKSAPDFSITQGVSFRF